MSLHLALSFMVSNSVAATATIAQQRDTIYPDACGQFAGISPFIAVAAVRGYERGPAADADDDGVDDDDRNDEPALSVSAFGGGGVSLTGCVPMWNAKRYAIDPKTASRGAFRIGASLALEGGSMQGESAFHLPLGFTAYFHPRPGTAGDIEAVFGLTVAYDLIGWTPDLTTSFVGDTRRTGIVQQLAEDDYSRINEGWVVFVNTGFALPASK